MRPVCKSRAFEPCFVHLVFAITTSSHSLQSVLKEARWNPRKYFQSAHRHVRNKPTHGTSSYYESSINFMESTNPPSACVSQSEKSIPDSVQFKPIAPKLTPCYVANHMEKSGSNTAQFPTIAPKATPSSNPHYAESVSNIAQFQTIAPKVTPSSNPHYAEIGSHTAQFQTIAPKATHVSQKDTRFPGRSSRPCGMRHLSDLKVELGNEALWRTFHDEIHEMKITKTGRYVS